MQCARHETQGQQPRVQVEGIIPAEREKPTVTTTSDLENIPLSDGGPTEEEYETLRKVAGSLPWSAFLVAAIELCERFAYYGLNGPFQVRRLV